MKPKPDTWELLLLRVRDEIRMTLSPTQCFGSRFAEVNFSTNLSTYSLLLLIINQYDMKNKMTDL